jgi:type II secretory pathway component GspD/PulD (secretin)
MTRQAHWFTLRLLFFALLAGICALGTQAADVPEPAQFVSEIIPIKYEKASDIAAALTRMTTNSVGAAVALGGPNEAVPPGTPASTNANATSNACNVLDQRIQHILRAAAAFGEIQNIGQSRIISDERTNSLLIYATPKDMRALKEIISRLDHPQPQVLVEAAIIQVALGDSESSRCSLFRGSADGPNNYSLGAGMLSSSNLSFVSDLVPMAETDTAGGEAIESDHLAKPAKDDRAPSMTTKPKANQRAGFAYLARVSNDLDALVLALATNSRVRILQRPRVQTSSGEPACLFVGESRPFSTNDYYGGGAYSSYPAIRQISAGVTLEVTPFAKPDGSVEMCIHQVLDQFAGTVTITNVGDVPITTSSEAQASLTVRDRETLLLGGWIQGLASRPRSGVPLLKDLPVLGALFRSSPARKPQRELIVLIRPTVLPSEAATASTAKAGHNQQAEAND